MDIGIVIPTFNLCSHRLRSLRFALTNMMAMETPNIYVIEQQTKNEGIRKLLESFPRVRYMMVDIKSGVFNKSKLINKAVSKLQFKYIWVYDVDVFLNTVYVLNNIPPNVDLVRPFEKIIMLNEDETLKLIGTNLIYLDKKPHSGYNSFGKFSIIFKKEMFEKLGGYDEHFTGWGFQDLDFIKRVPTNCYKGYTDNTAFHMYHPRAPTELYNENKSMFGKKGFFKKPKNKKIKKKNLLENS